MAVSNLRKLTLALAAGGVVVATPAAAFPQGSATQLFSQVAHYDDDDDDDYRGRWERRDDRRYDRRYARGYRGYGEPVYRNTRVWRGEDGRAYCRKSDGTTGLIVGGAAGALLGREIAGRRGDRTLGAILGAAGGALLGKSIDSKVRCN